MEQIIKISIYDVYGLKINDLETAKQWIEKRLGIILKLHNSSYLGGDYYRGDSTSYKLLKNCYDYDGEEDWIEEEHQEYGIIFQVNDLPNCDETRDILLNNSSEIINVIRRTCINEYQKYRISKQYHYIGNKYILYEESKTIKWF